MSRRHTPKFAFDSEKIFRSVFSSTDPLGAPFTDDIECRAILYPVGLTLFEDEFQAIAGAAALGGESQMYVVSLSPAGNAHYKLPFDYAAYTSIPEGVECALYGASGEWGLLFSLDGHGILGGTRAFIDYVREAFPPTEPPHAPDERWEPLPVDAQIHAFLRGFQRWQERGQGPYPWLRILLTHVYGEQRASELRRQYRL